MLYIHIYIYIYIHIHVIYFFYVHIHVIFFIFIYAFFIFIFMLYFSQSCIYMHIHVIFSYSWLCYAWFCSFIYEYMNNGLFSRHERIWMHHFSSGCITSHSYSAHQKAFYVLTIPDNAFWSGAPIWTSLAFISNFQMTSSPRSGALLAIILRYQSNG